MTAVFERILDMSLTAAVVIAAVLVIRLLLAKAPKKWSYALWSVAAFRLVCPVSFRSVFSLFTLTGQVGQALPANPTPAPLPAGGAAVSPVTTVPPVPTVPGITTPIPSGPVVTPPVVTAPAVSAPVVSAPVTQAPAAPAFDWAHHAMDIAAVIWLIGVAALVIYGVVSCLRLCRRMSTATRLEGRIWQSERVQSPFILGFIKPKIYIPYRLGAEEQRYVLAHENYHLRRLDHIARPLSFFILALHWFNPLVWLAYWLAGRDMEMSCDEKVLSKGESAKLYSATLLSFAANRRMPAPGPLAFGESGVKGRVKNALHWRRPRVWVTAIALILCIVVIAACAADPEESPGEPKTYVSVERLYWNMTSSYYDPTPNEDGLTYRIGPGSVAVTESGTALYGSDRPDWLLLTAEVWDELDLMPHASQVWAHQAIEACEAPRYLDLGDRRYLMDLDGEYWSCRAGVSVHRLAEEGAVVERTYHSVECLYLTLVSSQLPEADSGLEYVIGPHRAAVLNHVGDVVAETRAVLWQPITREWWEEAPLLSSFCDQLWEAIEACESPRYLPVDERHYLLDLDGTYWAGERGKHPNGTAHWWDIYRLEEGNRHPGGAPNAGTAIPMPSPTSGVIDGM